MPDTFANVDCIAKDSNWFADVDSGGWRYAAFNYTAASDTFTPATKYDTPPLSQTTSEVQRREQFVPDPWGGNSVAVDADSRELSALQSPSPAELVAPPCNIAASAANGTRANR